MKTFLQVIVDGGATKTEFAVLKNSELIHQFFATGINANYATDEQIEKVFSHFIDSLKDYKAENIDLITYYGAGCANEKNAMRLATIITRYFPNAQFKVYSDLMGACHALCGNNGGLVAILGTGSSSCLYDGEKIIQRAPSLGYLIGDEGSGTHLGKKFIIAYMMQQLPRYLLDTVDNEFSLDYNKVIERIYRKNNPNKFFASFAPFIEKNLEDPFIKELCKNSFNEFFDVQIDYYKKFNYPGIGLMGSVAYHFKELFLEIAAERGLTLSTIISSPMPKLIEYHNSMRNNK